MAKVLATTCRHCGDRIEHRSPTKKDGVVDLKGDPIIGGEPLWLDGFFGLWPNLCVGAPEKNGTHEPTRRYDGAYEPTSGTDHDGHGRSLCSDCLAPLVYSDVEGWVHAVDTSCFLSRPAADLPAALAAWLEVAWKD